jgi:ubiquinone biosynthesis protein UbiJ
MLNDYFAATITKSLNYCLALDETAKQRLAALAGKNISIHIVPCAQAWQLHIKPDQLELLATEQYPADLKITGTALNFFASLLAAKHKAGQQPWLISNLSLSGDIKLGQQLFFIIAKLNVDWQAHLAERCGANIASYLDHGLQQILGYFNNVQQRLSQHVSEYLQEESLWLAPTTLVNDFLQEVDTLVMQVDRLAAHLEHKL